MRNVIYVTAGRPRSTLSPMPQPSCVFVVQEPGAPDPCPGAFPPGPHPESEPADTQGSVSQPVPQASGPQAGSRHGHRQAQGRPEPALVLELQAAVLRYPPAPLSSPPALAGLSLGVAPGESVGVVGRTGAGKSSLLAAISRLTELTSGKARRAAEGAAERLGSVHVVEGVGGCRMNLSFSARQKAPQKAQPRRSTACGNTLRWAFNTLR